MPGRRWVCGSTSSCPVIGVEISPGATELTVRIRHTWSAVDPFYDLLTSSALNIVEGVALPVRFVRAPGPERADLAVRMRQIEHAGDNTTQAVMELLDTSFVPPFDRERIYRLPDEVDEQAALLSTVPALTAGAMSKLRAPGELVAYWSEINQVENEADQGYRRLLAGSTSRWR